MRYKTSDLEKWRNKGKEIGLHPSLRDFPRSEDQADRLLEIQQMVEDHYKNVIGVMDRYSFKGAQREEEQAFKKLNELIDYCSKFTDPEADKTVKQLEKIKLPLATDPNRYKTQQMKVWMRKDLIRLLDGFKNKQKIISALITLIIK